MKILTDYLILPQQSPLWQERVDYLFDMPSPLRSLSRSAPCSFLERVFKKLDNSHIINALRIFFLRKEYDLIITGIFQVSEFFGFFQYLFPKSRKKHLIIDFMLDEERKTPFWQAKVYLQKRAFGQADKILVFSREEARDYSKRFSIPVEKFTFIPYHTNVITPEYIPPGDEAIVFSAGRSGRDYRTFVAAVKDIPCKAIILCDKENLEGIKVPDNCTVYYTMPHSEYLEILKKAVIVAIPLGKYVRSMGLMVMLEAMAYGKAVVITKGKSNVEYVADNKNAIFSKCGDYKDMREKILYLLNNEKKRESIAKRALNDVKENWTFEIFVDNLFSIADEISKKT